MSFGRHQETPRSPSTTAYRSIGMRTRKRTYLKGTGNLKLMVIPSQKFVKLGLGLSKYSFFYKRTS